jgi:amino acid permease
MNLVSVTTGIIDTMIGSGIIAIPILALGFGPTLFVL